MSRPHVETERPLHGPLQVFDLGGEVAKLYEEREWREGKRDAITLRKDGGLSVVLLAMRAGDRLEEHGAPGPISVCVREGSIRFTTPDESVEAGPETMFTCDAGVRHTVEALEDTVYLLTIALGKTTTSS